MISLLFSIVCYFIFRYLTTPKTIRSIHYFIMGPTNGKFALFVQALYGYIRTTNCTPGRGHRIRRSVPVQRRPMVNI